MSETIEITRYPNRRLYDRSHKTYVTVGDIEAMVVGGQNVCVLDNKTGEDLTRTILTQIILERHPERMKMFPVAFLHEILRADRFSLDWFTVYFGQAQKLLDGVTRSSKLSLVPGLDFWQAFMPVLPKQNAASDTQSPLSQKVTPEGVTPEGDIQPAADVPATPSGDVTEHRTQQELAARLVELERRLNQLERENASEPIAGELETRQPESSDDEV